MKINAMENESLNSGHVEVVINDETKSSAQRKLKLACIFALSFMLAEIFGGVIAGSLAIVTDAAHLFSDLTGFLISLFALWIGDMPASYRMTYGFQRAEVIGALGSVMFIWIITGCLVYTAFQRLFEDLGSNAHERVNGKLMFSIACIGLCVNLALMKILGHSHSHGGHGHSHGGHGCHGGHGHSHGAQPHEQDSHVNTYDSLDHKPDECILQDTVDIEDAPNDTQVNKKHSHGHGLTLNGPVYEDVPTSLEGELKKTKIKKRKLENINIEAAYIHALGDFFQSIGVCIAGALIWYNHKYQIADPIVTLLFSILVIGTTMGILRSSLNVLMEGSPDGIDTVEIEIGLRDLTAVESLHELHIWSLAVGKPSVSVHLISENPDLALRQAQEHLLSKGISHSTIQVEEYNSKYPKNCLTHSCGLSSPSNSSNSI